MIFTACMPTVLLSPRCHAAITVFAVFRFHGCTTLQELALASPRLHLFHEELHIQYFSISKSDFRSGIFVLQRFNGSRFFIRKRFSIATAIDSQTRTYY